MTNKTFRTTFTRHRNQAGFATLAVLLLAMVMVLLFSVAFEFQLLRMKQAQAWAKGLQSRAAALPISPAGAGK